MVGPAAHMGHDRGAGAVSDNRVPVTVRLSPEGLAEIDKLAEADERDRSAMIRLLLREALAARQRKTTR